MIVLWVLGACAVIGAMLGLRRQNPVAGFMLGLGYGPIGVILAWFLEGDAPDLIN